MKGPKCARCVLKYILPLYNQSVLQSSQVGILVTETQRLFDRTVKRNRKGVGETDRAGLGPQVKLTPGPCLHLPVYGTDAVASCAMAPLDWSVNLTALPPFLSQIKQAWTPKQRKFYGAFTSLTLA